MSMQTTHLGRAGLSVSRICLGTMNFGPYTTPEDSFAIMDRALDAGIQFFDTADVYGRQAGRGATEAIVGNWLAQGNGRREQVVLATKVYGATGDGPNDRRLSARHIRQACEDSLRRLHTDHIDLYQMHHVDRGTPWDEIWQAMEQLIRAGKILYVGSSNFAAWHIVKANCAARERGLLGVVSEQSIYHLNNRTVELEVLPMCEAEGVGLLPWSPRRRRPARRRAEEGERRAPRHRLHPLARREAPPADRGVREAVRRDRRAAGRGRPRLAPPPGGGDRTDRRPAHDGAPRGRRPRRRCELNADVLKKLDDIFPGPGGPAPEAYAW